MSFHVIGRLAQRQSLTGWDVAALRFAGAFLTALPFLFWRGWPRIAPRRLPAIMVFAGFGFPILAYVGYQHAPAAHGATIMAAGLPVAATLLGLVAGQEQFSWRKMASLGIVVAGSLLLTAVTSSAFDGAWRGDLIFLVAITSWAVYTVLVQRWKLPALDATLVIALLAAPLYLPVWWLLLPSGMAQASWGAILFQLVFHGCGASVLAGILYTSTVAAIGAGPTTMMGAVVPALAALIAWPLLGEALPPLGVVAVLVVSAGTLLGVFGRAR